MSNFDYILIACFTLIIVFAGLSFSRTGSNITSFFSGGGQIPWWISSISLFMSFFSAGTFVVWGSIAYESGFVAITIQWMMAISGLIIYFFIAKKWKQANVLTAAEFITRRFGRKTQKVYTYLFVLISFFTAGAFLYPVAKIVNVSTGYSIEAVIIFLGITILLYTVVGGLWAVLATDVLQFIILTAGVIILVPLSLKAADGFSTFVENTPDTFFNITNSEYNWGFLIGFLIYNTFFIGGNWAYVQRYTSVSSPKNAKKVALLFAALYLIFPLIWMLPPMLYRSINPVLDSVSQTEGAYLMISKQVLPTGMLGLMIAGMVFATASSVNTTLNMMAAVTTNDLFKSWKPYATEKQLMKVARWSTLIFGVITILVALTVPSLGGIVNVVLSIAAITGVALYAPPIWGLFSKRLTGRDIITVTTLSLFLNLILKFFSSQLFHYSPDRTTEQLAGALIPLVLLACAEFIRSFSPKANMQFENYEKDHLKTPTTTGTLEDIKGKFLGIRTISVAAACTGALMILISIIAKTGVVYLLVLGLVITLGSLSAYRYSNRHLKKLKA